MSLFPRHLRCRAASFHLLLFCLIALPQYCLAANLELSPAERDWLRLHPVVRTRVSKAYPPFEFFENGRYQGMACDYLKLVGQRLGIRFEPVEGLNWSESLQGLQDRSKVDAVLLITHTEDRERYIRFTTDYISFPWVIFTPSKSSDIISLEDLGSRTVAVEQGYIVEEWLRRDVPSVKIMEVADTPTALMAVANGEADAYVGNLAVGSYLIDRNGLFGVKIAAPAPFGYDPLAMGVRSDWPELANMINKVLAGMTLAEKREIHQRWLQVRYEHGIQWQEIFIWMAVAGVLVITWIAGLRRAVGTRTAALKKEIALRRAKEEELRQSLETIRDSEQRMAFHINRMPLGYIAWDTDFTVTEWNPAAEQIFGYSATEAIGKHAFDLIIPPEARPVIEQFWLRLMTGEEARFSSNDNHDKTGRRLHCEWHSTPLRDNQGVTRGALSMVQDITERMNLEKLKEEMLSAVSHEMHTPLTVLLGFTEYLLGNQVDPQQQRDCLKTMLTEAQRLHELIENFLRVQRFRANTRDMVVREEQIVPFLEEACERYRKFFPTHPISLTTDPALSCAWFSKAELTQALDSLIANAVKFSPSGKTIAVAGVLSADHLVISVRDEGSGIPPDALEKIFDSFYRVDNTDRRLVGGVGLGLTLVREVAAAHGGSAWAESEEGNGSTFYFSIPIKQSATMRSRSGMEENNNPSAA